MKDRYAKPKVSDGEYSRYANSLDMQIAKKVYGLDVTTVRILECYEQKRKGKGYVSIPILLDVAVISKFGMTAYSAYTGEDFSPAAKLNLVPNYTSTPEETLRLIREMVSRGWSVTLLAEKGNTQATLRKGEIEIVVKAPATKKKEIPSPFEAQVGYAIGCASLQAVAVGAKKRK